MKKLTDMRCRACEGYEEKLTPREIKKYLRQVKRWKVVKKHHIVKEFRFKDFITALWFVNKVGKIAEREGHHPNILLKWGYVEVTLYTHKVNGLTLNDFIVAAKTDRIEY